MLGLDGSGQVRSTGISVVAVMVNGPMIWPMTGVAAMNS